MPEPASREARGSSEPGGPLAGLRLAWTLAWVAGVVLLYLAVRELGIRIVP